MILFEEVEKLAREIGLLSKTKLKIKIESGKYIINDINEELLTIENNDLISLFRTLTAIKFLMEMSYYIGERNGGINALYDFKEELKK